MTSSRPGLVWQWYVAWLRSVCAAVIFENNECGKISAPLACSGTSTERFSLMNDRGKYFYLPRADGGHVMQGFEHPLLQAPPARC